MRTQALSVAADAAMLQAIATVAAAVLPPAGFQLPKLKKSSRSATPGSSRRSRSTKGPPAMLLSNAVIAFEVRLMQGYAHQPHDYIRVHDLLLFSPGAWVAPDECSTAAQDCSVSYSTHVVVPERFRKPDAKPEEDCSMCLGLARFAAAMKPLDKQADIELCDLTLTYSEQPANMPGRCPIHLAFTH